MADNLIESLIRLAVDNSAAQRGKRAIADLRKEVRGIGTDAAKGSQQAVKELSLLERKARDVQKRMADQQAKGQRGASVGQGAGKLAQVAGAIGGAGASEPIRLIGDFSEALTTLGPIVALGGAAIGGLGLIIGELQKQSEAARQAILDEISERERQVGVEREIAGFVERGDVQGATARVKQLKEANEDANILLTEDYQRIAEINEALKDQDNLTLGQLAAFNQELAIREADRDARYKDFKARADEIDLIETAFPSIQKTADARKTEKEATDALNATLKAAPKAIEAFGNSLVKAAVDAFAKIKAEEDRKNQQRVNIAEDYNADVQKLTADGLQAQANAYDDYNKKLVNIADEAATAAEQALADLQSKRAELSLQLQRDEASATLQQQAEQLDAQINFQRDEARAARDHARDLKRIREDAQDDELQLIADRDFRSLYFSRRDTNRRIKQANEDYGAQRQERAIAFREQQADAAAAFERERQARLQKYQQDLADAQVQYNMEQAAIATKQARDLAALNDGYAKQRQALTTALNQQLNTLRIAAQEQLNLINQTEAAKSQIYNNSLQQAQQLASQVVSTAVSGAVPLPHYAAGGFLAAGRRAIVNEPGSSGREGFRTGRGTIGFPGFGMFTPLTSGNVQANRGGGKSINPTFNVNISGGNGNPDLIAKAVTRRVMREIEQLVS